MWDHTAVAAESKRVVSFVVGKRTQAQTRALICDAKKRLRPGHMPAILTDAYDGYESAIVEAFGQRYPRSWHGAKGRAPRPLVRWPHGLAYGQVKKSYKRGRVDQREVRALYGKARLQQVLSLLGDHKINTSVAEWHNATSRLRNRRKARKTSSKARR